MKIVAKFFLICVIGLVLTGCLNRTYYSGGTMSFLEKDTIEKDKGVVLVRLKIKDTTNVPSGVFAAGYSGIYHPYFSCINDDLHESSSARLHDTGQKVWTASDNTYYFDQVYYIQAEPGTYYCNSVSFYLGRSQGATNIITHTFNVPVKFAFDLKAGKIGLIGTISIDVTKAEGERPRYNSISYSSHFNRTREDVSYLLDEFKKNYPVLAASADTREFAIPYRYFYHVDFSVNADDRRKWPWIERKDYSTHGSAEYSLGYIMEGNLPDKDRHNYVFDKNQLDLSDNYAATVKLRWIKGSKNAVYGFLLMADKNNQYYVGTTADGLPAVWVKKEGNFLDGPNVTRPSTFLANKDRPDVFTLERSGNKYTYSINGKIVSFFEGDLDMSKANIGMFVSGTQSVLADSIIIRYK